MHLRQTARGRRLFTIVLVGAVAICFSDVVDRSLAQSTNRFIAGRVRYTNTGTPAKQASVELLRRGSRKRIKLAKTDAGGNYRFDNVAPGLYRLKLHYKPGVCAQTLDVDVRNNSEPEANIITEGC